MTPDRVRQLIDAYGAEPERWPAPERDAARRLIAADPALAAYAREAEAVDALIKGADKAVPPAWLAQRILNGAPGRRAAPRDGGWLRQLWPFGAAWQPAGALAASLAVGLWAGASGIAPAPFADNAQTAAIYTEEDVAFALYGFAGAAAEEWGYDG